MTLYAYNPGRHVDGNWRAEVVEAIIAKTVPNFFNKINSHIKESQ